MQTGRPDGELEAASRLGAAVLLTLDDAAVAGQEAAGLQDPAQAGIMIGQRPADAVTDRTGLAGQPAAGDRAPHVVLAEPVGHQERLVDDHPQHGAGEIDLALAAVDDHLARTGLHPDAGDRVLALAGGVGTALRIDLLDMFGSVGRGIDSRLQSTEGRQALTFGLRHD
jgi:hypothetical protein